MNVKIKRRLSVYEHEQFTGINVGPWLALVATQLHILKSCAFFPEQVSWLSNSISTLFKIALFNCTIGVDRSGEKTEGVKYLKAQHETLYLSSS